MTNYVVGFLFAEDKQQQCLFVKKNKPEFMAGKWNGIGGSIASEETPFLAMCREAKEEANLDVDWFPFAELHRPDTTIFCFWSSVKNCLDVPEFNDVGEEHRWLVWQNTDRYFLFESVPMLLELARLDPPGICEIWLGEPK